MSVGPVIRRAGHPAGRSRTSLRVRPGRGSSQGARRWWRVSAIAIGAIVLCWAFAPFVLVAIDAAARHRVFLGVAGYYPMDGLQYLAWVRDAHDGLIRNLYGSLGRPVFLHPMYSLTGIVQGATGVGPVAIMAFWKTVGALVLFAGSLRIVARSIAADRARRRTIAVVLALFGGFTPVVALLPWLDTLALGTDFNRAGGDLVPAMALWDYAPLAIALGLMPFAIERIERLVSGREGWPTAFGASTLGLLVAWLHPWQGITLIAVTAGLVLWRAHEARGPGWAAWPRALAAVIRGRVLALGLVAGATGAPVLYYLLLSHVDGAWATSELNSVSAALIPGFVTLLCVVPLGLAGMLAARATRTDPAIRSPLLWLLATLVTIAVSPSGQYRALDGLAIPVAVLVVRAWPEWRHRGCGRLLATVALAGALIPFAWFAVGAFGHLRSPGVTSYTELNPSDVRAAKLAAADAGGMPVLAPAELGTAIPALTDAVSWLGHPIWTPDYVQRKMEATELFSGGMDAVQARRFVASTAARVVVDPCGAPAGLQPALAPLGFHAVKVGCAVVLTRGLGLDALRFRPTVSSLGGRPSTLRG